MLVDSLLAYLTRVVPDAKLSTYKDVLPFLYQLDPGTFEFQFNQFTTYLDEFHTQDNIAQFDQTVATLLGEGIEEFGVYLSDDLPLTDKIGTLGKLCRALYHVDQFEDLMGIRAALEMSINPRETVADILHLIDNTLDPYRVLEVTVDVSPALLSRLREYLKEMEYRFPDNVDGAQAAHIESVKDTLTFYGIERAVRYFKDGGRVGEPLNAYLDYYFGPTNTDTPDTLAKLALFSAVAAGIPANDIKDQVAAQLPNYFTDPKTLLTLSRAVVKMPLPRSLYAEA